MQRDIDLADADALERVAGEIDVDLDDYRVLVDGARRDARHPHLFRDNQDSATRPITPP